MLTREQHINENLINSAISLDISPSDYMKAIERYASLKKHLEEGNYPSIKGKPEIYMQGSFVLGTVVRPYIKGKDAEYDIDAVCELEREKTSTTPKGIKQDVGAEVKLYAKKHSMKEPEDKRRCWVLEYTPDTNGFGFHLDVLPCIPDPRTAIEISRLYPTIEQYTKTTVSITNRNDNVNPPQYDWRSSNPNGYAKWFYDINLPSFVIFEREQRHLIFEQNRSLYSRESDIPRELIHTPLQRAIQILKRHRDVYFSGHKWEKHKPISMIITTLAGKLYEGKASSLRTVYDTLVYIVKQIIAHAGLLEPMQYLSEEISALKLIQRVGDKWYIPNPVNPHLPSDPADRGENFADRWHEGNHVCAHAFFDWIKALEDTFGMVDKNAAQKDILKHLDDNLRVSTRLSSPKSSGILLGAPVVPGVIKTTPKPWGFSR